MTEENATLTTATSPEKKKSKKGLILIPVVLLAAAAGGYGFFWNKQTARMETEAKKVLDELSKATLKDKGYEFKYQGIERAGFPFSTSIRIINPEYRISGLLFKDAFKELQKAPMTQEQRVLADQTLAGWVEAYRVEGAVELYSNPFSRQVGFAMDGAVSNTSQLNNQVLSWGIPATNRLVNCSAQLTTDAAFKVLKSAFEQKSLLEVLPAGQAVERIGCDTPAYQIFTSDGKESLYSVGKSHFSLSNSIPKPETISGHFVAKVNDAITSNKLMQHYAAIGYIFGGGINMMQFQHTDQFGKQNIDIDINYDGPVDFANSVTKNEPFSLRFNTFKLTNNAYNIDWPLNISNSFSNGSSNYSIDTLLRMKFTPVYDKILADAIKALPTDPSVMQTPLGKSLKDMAAKLGGNDKLGEVLVSYLPSFSEMGEIRIGTKASVIKQEPTKDELSGSNLVTIDSAELGHDKYGFQLGGKFDANKFAGSFVLKCVNCDAMIDNGLGHMVNVGEFMRTLLPDSSKANYDAKTVLRAKEFMHQITVEDKDTPTTRLLTIKDNGNKDVLINDKTMMEVMMLWMKVFIPEAPLNADIPTGAMPNSKSTVAPENVRE